MARYRITSPDGKQTVEVDGPDDATDAELQEFSRQQFNGQFKDAGVALHRAQQPAAPQQFEDPEHELFRDIGHGVATMGEGFAKGVGHVLDRTNQFFGSMGLTTGDTDYESQFNPDPKLGILGTIPEIAGEAAATIPLAALPGGPLVQGAVGGALVGKETDPVGIAKDALLGGVGAKLGQSLFRGAAAVAAPPEVSNGLKTLMQAGVRVEPGQVARSYGMQAGDKFATWVDKATSGAAGSRIVGNRQNGFTDYARATINRAVEPIGQSLPDNIPPGRRAIKWAGDQLSNAYEALLPNLRVQGDGQFLDDIATVHQSAATLAPAKLSQFNSTLRSYERLFKNGTDLSGEALKDVDRRLAERVSRFSRSQMADDQDLGDAFQAVRDSVHELIARQNPEYAGELQQINQGWKGLVQVEKASANSKGNITPNGYSQAVRQSSDTVRNRGYARGDALNQDLADAGSEILPSEYPDSGTAGRWDQAGLSFLGAGKGAFDTLRYRAAEATQPLMLREQFRSPNAAKILNRLGRVAPVIAPALISGRQ